MGFFREKTTKILILLIKAYRLILSPILPPTCRHYPTCSQYAIDTIKINGVFSGVYLAMKRILRCRPGGTSGYDPAEKIK